MIPEEQALMVYPDGREEQLKRVSQKAWHDRFAFLKYQAESDG